MLSPPREGETRAKRARGSLTHHLDLREQHAPSATTQEHKPVHNLPCPQTLSFSRQHFDLSEVLSHRHKSASIRSAVEAILLDSEENIFYLDSAVRVDSKGRDGEWRACFNARAFSVVVFHCGSLHRPRLLHPGRSSVLRHFSDRS